MTRSTNMEHVEVLRGIRDWMDSIYLDSRVAALDAAIASLSAPQPAAEAHPVAKLVNRKDADGGKTTTFIRPTSLGMDLPLGEYPLHLHPPPSAPVGVEGWRVEPVEDDPDMLAVETPDGRTWFAKRGDRVFELAEALALAQQPAAEVYVDFPQVGTAGPFAVVDGKVTLPDTTMNDLIRHARTGYVEQPAAVDEVHELRLCESSRLHLFPGRLYRFTVDPDCKMCADAASNCDLAQQGGGK